IESLIPAGFGKLAALANRFRPRVKQAIEEENGRRKFWEQVFEGRIAEAVFSGNEAEAEDLLERALANQNPVNQGEVYLVGGGPGDPDLLTFRALRLMQRADIVL